MHYTFPGASSLRKFFFVLFLLPLFVDAKTPAESSAGSFSFAWGDNYELPARHADVGFIGGEEDGYIQVGHQVHKSLSFQHFDPLLHLTTTTSVALDNMPDDYRIVSFSKIDGKYYWFFCTWERKDETERLFVQELDVKNAKLVGNAKELAACGKIVSSSFNYTPSSWTGFGGGWGIALTDKWNLFYSVDKKKILVQYRSKPEKRNDALNNDIIGFHVFDTDMNKVWGNEIRMPYSEKKMDNEDYTVDKDGNVYCLARVYSEEKGDRNSPNYRMEILKWTKDNKQVAKIPFKMGNNFVNSAVITPDFSGNLMVVGFYSKKRGGTSTDGVFMLKLNEQTGELTNIKKGLYEFPERILSEFESGRTKRRNEKRDDDDKLEAPAMDMRNVYVKQDGSVQIVGEEHYIKIVRTYGRYTTTTYHYYYNDILSINIGADGEMKWCTKIPKQQYGVNTGRGGMSFKMFNYGSDQYFLFMDNMKNVDIAPDEQPARHVERRGGILMAVKVDKDGKKSKAKVFDIREEDMNVIVTNFDEVGANKLIARAFHRKQSQPFSIQFK
jgi:hypothetical protein